MFAPLTLVGSWFALRSAAAHYTATQAGVAVNALVLFGGLGLLTAVWGFVGPLVVAWIVLVVLVVLLSPSVRAYSRRSRGRLSGKETRPA